MTTCLIVEPIEAFDDEDNEVSVEDIKQEEQLILNSITSN